MTDSKMLSKLGPSERLNLISDSMVIDESQAAVLTCMSLPEFKQLLRDELGPKSYEKKKKRYSFTAFKKKDLLSWVTLNELDNYDEAADYKIPLNVINLYKPQAFWNVGRSTIVDAVDSTPCQFLERNMEEFNISWIPAIEALARWDWMHSEEHQKFAASVLPTLSEASAFILDRVEKLDNQHA